MGRTVYLTIHEWLFFYGKCRKILLHTWSIWENQQISLLLFSLNPSDMEEFDEISGFIRKKSSLFPKKIGHSATTFVGA